MSPVRVWEAPPFVILTFVPIMSRVAKKPQYEAFNLRHNCFGRFQKHNLSLDDWRRSNLPLMLEVGAGTAAVSLQFSLDNPDWQVLALDRKSDRLNKAASKEVARNLAFLQADFKDLLNYVDLRKQVNLLWLAFSDPQAGERRAKHRLTHPSNFDLYKTLLVPAGKVRFKTDDKKFFNYTYDAFNRHPDFAISAVEDDLIAAGYENQAFDVQTVTGYERRYLELGRPIHYLEAVLEG